MTRAHAYQAHAEKLATVHAVQLMFHDEFNREDACSAVHRDGRRGVFAHPIDDDTSYAVVLHEIGHHAAKHGRQDQLKMLARLVDDERLYTKVMLTEERAAWAWAEANALEWTIGMESVKRTCMDGYERREQRVAA